MFVFSNHTLLTSNSQKDFEKLNSGQKPPFRYNCFKGCDGMDDKQIEIIRHFNREYTQRLGILQKNVFNSEISWSEARILMEISHLKNPTPIKISNNLELDKSYVSRVIKRLNNLNYVEKTTSKDDKRAKLLVVTTTGKKVVEDLNTNSDEQIKSMVSNLNKQEQEEFYQSINALNKLLEKGGINHVED